MAAPPASSMASLLPMVKEYIYKSLETTNRSHISLLLTAFTKAHIEAAVAHMLTIKDFVKHSGFDASDLYIDRFYANMRHDMPVLVDDDLIDWAGYSGGSKNEMYAKRLTFQKALKSLDKNSTRIELSFDALVVFKRMLTEKNTLAHVLGCSSQTDTKNEEIAMISRQDIDAMYPDQPCNQYTKQRIYSLVPLKILDQILMRIDTERGEQVRMHFIKLKELMYVYMMYQRVYEHMRAEIEKTSLLNKMDEANAIAKQAAIDKERHHQETLESQDRQHREKLAEGQRIHEEQLAEQRRASEAQMAEQRRIAEESRRQLVMKAEEDKREREEYLAGVRARHQEVVAQHLESELAAQARHAELLRKKAESEEAARIAKMEIEIKFYNAEAEASRRHTELMRANNAHAAELADINANFEHLNDAIEARAPDLVHSLDDRSLSHNFIVMANDVIHKYRAIRTQAYGTKRAITAAVRAGYKREVIRIENTQGPMNSWCKIKERFAGAKFAGLYCTLNEGTTEDQFVAAIRNCENLRTDVTF